MTVSAIIQGQLTALAGTVANQYQPLLFRSFLNVTQLVPSWAQQGQFIKVKVSSDMKLTSQLDNTLPLASHERDSRNFDIVEFANAYMVMRGELERAAQEPGYQLDTILAQANQRRAEYVQSQFAMLGKFQGAAVGNCKGILNLADATDFTTAAGLSTTFVKADGTILEDDATVILGLVDNMIASYPIYAGYDMTPSTFAIPQWQWKAFIARSAVTNERVIDIVRANYPTINFVPVLEANEVSASGIDRFAMWSSNEEVQRCIIPVEYHELEASQDAMGNVLVPSVMKAGGVISNFPQGVMYVDMDRADVS